MGGRAIVIFALLGISHKVNKLIYPAHCIETLQLLLKPTLFGILLGKAGVLVFEVLLEALKLHLNILFLYLGVFSDLGDLRL